MTNTSSNTDGVPSHTANVVQAWCCDNLFDILPLSSPDLNLTDYFETEQVQNLKFESVQTIIQRVWDEILMEFMHLLSNSEYIPHHKDGQDKISAEKSFLMSLWYLSNRQTFREVSDRFDITLNSAYRSDGEAEVIAEGFCKKQGIQGVIGVIDESHIEILKPTNNQLAYINRKRYHNFIENKFVIGDTAYPNLHWLVTPFQDNGQLTQHHNTFNYKLSATRVVIEYAFGLLKGRFRRLKKLENLNKKLCSEIIVGACILHNICLDEKDFLDTDLTDFNQPTQVPYLSNLFHVANLEVNRQQQN
ncbi:hypothetical protein ILUMI_18334 [Ignelater luminosus]|uniref:DDE Tnp4 domain-containing protein n=1 Tax=Ignelater luminosus TaxID=2038154 RepID=A0A8K0CIG7_IGNLU|nr:hypothetical protein ILUMI_18334 [Ignelater luminosus]